jgi:hypothetical protein
VKAETSSIQKREEKVCSQKCAEEDLLSLSPAQALEAPKQREETGCAQEGEEAAIQQQIQDLTLSKHHLLEHIRMVTSLIEEREVSMEEILSMLTDILRQHSIGKKTNMDYIIELLNKKPP